MHNFEYRHGELYCEQVPVSRIAKEVGTPCYIYSHATLVRHFRAYDGAFKSVPHVIAFAMKANSNIAILRLMAKEGSGVDIVSGGELFRALKAGVPPSKIVFAGVGKSAEEIREALTGPPDLRDNIPPATAAPHRRAPLSPSRRGPRDRPGRGLILEPAPAPRRRRRAAGELLRDGVEASAGGAPRATRVAARRGAACLRPAARPAQAHCRRWPSPPAR